MFVFVKSTTKPKYYRVISILLSNELNEVNQSCQKDNIARRRQPYVNSNNK